MRFPNYQIISLLALLVLSQGAGGAGGTISKCQDASGKWHYGDHAASECDTGASVTEFLESGIMIKVHEPPPDAEVLRKQREQLQKELDQKQQREEKLRDDRQLLNQYANEQVIFLLRDQRLGELGKQLAFNRKILADLEKERSLLPESISEYQKQEVHDLEQRIGRFERAIEQGIGSIAKTENDYKKLLDRYRQIEVVQ